MQDGDKAVQVDDWDDLSGEGDSESGNDTDEDVEIVQYVKTRKRGRLEFSDSEEQFGEDAEVSEGELKSASEAEVETVLATSSPSPPAKRQKLRHGKDVLTVKINLF